MNVQARCVIDCKNDLGEGPVWDVATARLWWVDVNGRKIFHADPGVGPVEEYAVPDRPGCLAVRSDGTLIIALRRGVILFDPTTGTHRDVPCPIDFGVERFNDGACDRRGRFFAGTMHKEMNDRIGGLYRVDADLSVHRVAGDICLSNGIAWSPDNRTLYHCDSRPGVVFAYDYDIEAGTVANRRVFADFDGRVGGTDGCTVDAEGGLWVAEVGAGQIVRFLPDGRIDRVVKVPVTRLTSVMFGGPDLRTLFVTSMRYHNSEESLAAEPQAGGVFALDVGVAGLPEPRFAG